ncbi:MAG: hypothetical protein ABI887_00500 [Burkholderiales bacterium]
MTTKDIDAAFGYVELFLLRDKGAAKVVWSAAQDSYRFTRQTVLLVDDDFATRQPQIVQRVVDTVVKTARAYSDESQRGELFAQWGKAEFPEKIWREDFIGQPLRVRLSPLLDPFLVARYKDASDEAFKLRLTRSKLEIDSWFDRRFLNAALKAQQLEGYWPEYAADGNPPWAAASPPPRVDSRSLTMSRDLIMPLDGHAVDASPARPAWRLSFAAQTWPRLRDWLLAWLLPLAVLALWALAAHLEWIAPQVLPSPDAVACSSSPTTRS